MARGTVAFAQPAPRGVSAGFALPDRDECPCGRSPLPRRAGGRCGGRERLAGSSIISRKPHGSGGFGRRHESGPVPGSFVVTGGPTGSCTKGGAKAPGPKPNVENGIPQPGVQMPDWRASVRRGQLASRTGSNCERTSCATPVFSL